MPAPEWSDLYQVAVLWPWTGYDRFGQHMVGPPVEIPVRWNTQRTEQVDAQGNTVTVDGTVIVDRYIDIGSHLWLGTLADWYGVGSSSGGQSADDSLCEAKTFNEVPDLKNRFAFRTVGIMRLRQHG